jgi:hypothetical protein
VVIVVDEENIMPKGTNIGNKGVQQCVECSISDFCVNRYCLDARDESLKTLEAKWKKETDERNAQAERKRKAGIPQMGDSVANAYDMGLMKHD